MESIKLWAIGCKLSCSCFCLQTTLPGSLADSLLPPSHKHTCSHCGRSFSRVSNIRRLETMHSGCYPCWCEICGKRGLSANNRTRYMTIHTSVRPCNQQIYGSFRVKSTNFQEMQHDPSQMFPKKILKIPQYVLMTQTKF